MRDYEEFDKIQQRVNNSYSEMRRQLNMGLYGDSVDYKPPPKWRQFLRRWSARFRAAWQILRYGEEQ